MRARVAVAVLVGALALGAAAGFHAGAGGPSTDWAAELRRAVVLDDRAGWEVAVEEVDHVDEASFGVTALHVAARLGRAAAAAALIDAGADVDLAQPDGDTALHLAVIAGSPAVLELLLRAGANPDLPGVDRGGTPVHLAARGNDVEALRILAAAGADLRALRRDGMSPVVAAACAGSAEAVAWLLAREVPMGGRGLRTEHVPSALECARAGGHAEVVAILAPAA